MPRRRMVRGAAAGLLGHFVSRNNDIEGYWALGRIYRDTKRERLAVARFDLLTGGMTPSSPDFERMLTRLQRLLAKQLEKPDLAAADLREAGIIVSFNTPSGIPARYGVAATGDPYVSVVRIVDGVGGPNELATSGRRRPHNPHEESRSMR